MYQIEGGYGRTLCLDKYKSLAELCIITNGGKEYIYADPAELKKAVDALATDIEIENKEKR